MVMNKTLLFAKYIENEMSEDEKSKFEKNLALDRDLKVNFEKFYMNYKKLNSEINVDEDYFVTLMPRVRERLSEKKKLFNFFSRLPKFVYIIPVFIIGAIVYYNMAIFKNKTDKNTILELSNELKNNSELFTEILNEHRRLRIIDDYDSEIYSIIYSDNEYENLILNYAEENNHIFELNEKVINELSEEDYNLVYNEIINKKIL